MCATLDMRPELPRAVRTKSRVLQKRIRRTGTGRCIRMHGTHFPSSSHCLPFAHPIGRTAALHLLHPHFISIVKVDQCPCVDIHIWHTHKTTPHYSHSRKQQSGTTHSNRDCHSRESAFTFLRSIAIHIRLQEQNWRRREQPLTHPP
jgi:hypothetical protein